MGMPIPDVLRHPPISEEQRLEHNPSPDRQLIDLQCDGYDKAPIIGVLPSTVGDPNAKAGSIVLQAFDQQLAQIALISSNISQHIGKITEEMEAIAQLSFKVGRCKPCER